MNRNTRTWKPAVLASLAVLAMAGSLAADTSMSTLHLEPSGTSVVFEVGTTFHKVHGTMKVIEGDIQFDHSKGTISGRVVVDATSAVTGNKKRDRKMHKEVLESELYPEIRFLPRGFKGELHREGLSELQIFGTIEIHGSTHEVEIPAQVEVSGDSITGTAVFTVPYIEWGMKDPSIFVLRVAKVVQVTVETEGVLAAPGMVSE